MDKQSIRRFFHNLRHRLPIWLRWMPCRLVEVERFPRRDYLLLECAICGKRWWI